MGTHIDSFYLRHLACTPQTGKLIGCIYRLFRLFAARHWTMCKAQQFQRQIHFWAGNIANFVLADEFIGFFPTKLAETRKTINQWEVGVKPKKNEYPPKNWMIHLQKIIQNMDLSENMIPIDTPKNCYWPLIIILLPIGSMVLLYMMTFTINIPQSC